MDPTDYFMEKQLEELRERMEHTLRKIRPHVGETAAGNLRVMFELMMEVQESALPVVKDGVKYRILLSDMKDAPAKAMDRVLNMRVNQLREQA